MEHPRADLVVLVIGLCGLDGDGPRAQQVDVLHFGRVGGGEGGAGYLGDAGAELGADALADYGEGEDAIVEEKVNEGVVVHIGGRLGRLGDEMAEEAGIGRAGDCALEEVVVREDWERCGEKKCGCRCEVKLGCRRT